jgi:RNA polymerase sigma-70 factor (ECF subfamily)
MRGDVGPDAAAEADAWIAGVLDRYETPLLLYATRLLRDADRAQDVVQEVFLSLCRADRAQVEPRLAPWLYTVARNRALNERRRPPETAVTTSPAAPEREDPARSAEARDAASRALEALERLPEAQQEALRLKFQHGLRYAEIAEVMRVTRGNVAVLVHRGIAALRTRLGIRAGGAAPAPGGGRP